MRALAALLIVAPLLAQPGRPLPDEKAFFAETQNNLARSNDEQYRYAYKERRTELHLNPFGRLGTGDSLVYDVTPLPAGEGEGTIRRLVERAGKPVTDSPPQRRQRRSRTRSRTMVDDVVNTLRFTLDRREALKGRDVILVHFEPRPDANPQTREGKIVKAFSGTIWIDESAREVMRLEATAISDLSYGLGVVARLKKGSAISMSRARMPDGTWLLTGIRVKGDGRAMVFRRWHLDHAIEWFDYRRVPVPGS